jgi:hypothetical protein
MVGNRSSASSCSRGAPHRADRVSAGVPPPSESRRDAPHDTRWPALPSTGETTPLSPSLRSPRRPAAEWRHRIPGRPPLRASTSSRRPHRCRGSASQSIAASRVSRNQSASSRPPSTRARRAWTPHSLRGSTRGRRRYDISVYAGERAHHCGRAARTTTARRFLRDRLIASREGCSIAWPHADTSCRPIAGYRAGSNSSIGLPSGSSIWICRPTGPASI